MEAEPLVIMNGSGWVQCGFGRDERPKAIFPNLFGGPKHVGIMVGMGRDEFVGDEALCKRGILLLKNIIPIDGSPTNFHYLEKIWHHTFYNELRVTPEEHTVLMTDLPEMDDKTRSRMMEILFEYYNIKGTYFSNPSVLASFAGESQSGVIIDSGYGRTRLIPVLETYPIIHAATKMENPIPPPPPPKEEEKKPLAPTDFSSIWKRRRKEKGNHIKYFKSLKDEMPLKPDLGGYIVTQYFVESLKELGYEMTTSAERHICQHIKEKLCYVSSNIDRDMMTLKENETFEKYELPDGSIMEIGSRQLFGAYEVMFRPELIGRTKTLGLHDHLLHAVSKCDPELQDMMHGNIILTGGNTMFEGLEDRLRSELGKIGIHAGFSKSEVPRNHRNWVGGSMLTQMDWFKRQEWITKDFYKHYGASILKRKCQRSFSFCESVVFASFFGRGVDEQMDLKDRIGFLLDGDSDVLEGCGMKIILREKYEIFVSCKIFLFG